ncbi:MAG: HD-GYP domain-containing protein [Lachnospiraceae bacterium]|nr:HD-GYP domain-containing protein [Lachnospiraceae bacterium]
MLTSYLTYNFITLMILLALISMMYVNKDVKIPATSLFVVSIGLLLIVTVAGVFDTSYDVSAMLPEEAARVVAVRTWASAIGYILRPCIILAELLIMLRGRKYRMLCVIPALLNAVVYSTTLFGHPIAFFIDANNAWHGLTFSKTVYVTTFLYLFILLYCSLNSFYTGDRKKSLILILVFTQAVLGGLFEYNGISEHTNTITALCLLEFYIYLATVYRQELKRKLDDYVSEVEAAGGKLKNLTTEVMEALAGAIDAKDTYTNGHSRRVAEYSRKIAEAAGKSAEDCEKIYFTALLHDVGKIGVPIEILTKKGRLTTEEYEQIKQHPVIGSQILSTISDHPWLSIGAHYHHERYNGKGYPDGLKGETIPEIARIIAVADAYDAMTSNRSYRDAIPQHVVREELVKGIGTQFDPFFARTMIRLIDLDTEYRMKESISGANAVSSGSIHCESVYHDCTAGIGITKKRTKIVFSGCPDGTAPEEESLPVLIIYDSLDGNVHPGQENNKDLMYLEYARIRLDGQVTEGNIRKSEIRSFPAEPESGDDGANNTDGLRHCRVEAVRNRDHVLITVSCRKAKYGVILALPDTSRYAFISVSGEHVDLSNVVVEVDDDETDSDALPRIAEELSYIKDCPVGDIPNVEVDGPRLASTRGIPISSSMTVTFHSFSYPTARLVWHCPYFSIFTSDNGQPDGERFREFLLLKLDGENWESQEDVDNAVTIDQTEDFEGWNAWMEKNKQGLDCTLKIIRDDNRIMMQTESSGVALNSVTTINDGTKDVYLAITGDQCAITDIRITRSAHSASEN